MIELQISKNEQKFASKEYKNKFLKLISDMENYNIDLDVFYINLSEKRNDVKFFAIIILIRTIKSECILNEKTREKFHMLKAKLILVPFNKQDESIVAYLTEDYCYFENKKDFCKFFNSFTPSYSWALNSNKFNAFVEHFFAQVPNKLNFSRIPFDERKSVIKYYPILPHNKQYCYGLKCLGKRKNGSELHRTQKNTNKAKYICAGLFDKIKDSVNISFCFSNDPKKERSESKILAQYARRRHYKK